MIDFEQQRRDMVERQIVARGVADERVLAALRAVPREAFVPDIHRSSAYGDAPLPIGEGQTISQPYIVAFMVEALSLKGDERVLEIGSGSGYAAAVLARCCRRVFAIERLGNLAQSSAKVLKETGASNVTVRHDDGTRGWPEEAPFDAILVSAGAPRIPEALKNQLAIGGRMVIPLGSSSRAQDLVRITRLSKDEFARENIADVRFVPLIGKQG